MKITPTIGRHLVVEQVVPQVEVGIKIYLLMKTNNYNNYIITRI